MNLDDLYQDLDERSRKATCAALIEEYLNFRKPVLAPRTIAIAHRSLMPFALICGYRPITGARIHDFLKARFEKSSNQNTRKRDVDWLRMFLKWCEEMDYVKDKLAVVVPRIQVAHTNPVIFTPEQYETIKAATRGTHWYHATIMAYRIGARISDVCLMKWSNIDFEGLIIRYVPWKSRKTNRAAIFPFQSGGDLHQVLRDLRTSSRNGEDGYISPYMAARYIEQHTNGIRGNFNLEFIDICKKAGVRGLSFHNLRNSFMSRVVSGGASFSQATQLTGLASEKVFLRYAKPDVNALRSTIEKIDGQDAIQPETIIQMPTEPLCSPPSSQEM